jgi:uncharacterized protein (DUF4415 family)
MDLLFANGTIEETMGNSATLLLAVWNRRFLLSCIRYEVHDIVLFQHGGLVDVNEERIVRYTQKNLPKGHTDWKRVKALTDEEIEAAVREDPEAAPIADEDFWKEATLVWPKEKQHISLRLDYEVYWWLKQYAKKEGKGYQTLINAILRSWIEIQKGKHPLPPPES